LELIRGVEKAHIILDDGGDDDDDDDDDDVIIDGIITASCLLMANAEPALYRRQTSQPIKVTA